MVTMRVATILAPCLIAAAVGLPAASAQTAATVPPPAAAAPQDADKTARPQRRIERIVTEDAGIRVDELRYGGETQSIAVQPKGGMPAYEIGSDAGSRARPAGGRDSATGGSGMRVWKLLDF